MTGYLSHLVERFVIFVVTIVLSVTVVFFVPRMVPGDPLGALSLKLAQVGGNLGGKALVDEYTSACETVCGAARVNELLALMTRATAGALAVTATA